MRRREIIMKLAATAWALAVQLRQQAQAQQRARAQGTLPLIGYLSSGVQRLSGERLRMFLEGLNRAGYSEGENISIEYRWAEGHYERLPALAGELIKQKVLLIVVPDSIVTAKAAKEATSTVPIVFGIGADPVRSGLVKSLNRPGGNLTGASRLNVELESKRLQILHEILPKVRTFAILVNPGNPNIEPLSKDTKEVALALEITLYVLHAGNDPEIDKAFAEMVRLGVGGLVIAPDPFFLANSAHLAQMSLVHRIPAIFQYREFASAGGLVSYAGNPTEGYRLIGDYVARILRGEKPEDLPVQQYAKLEMIINLWAARLLGVKVPEPLLAFADEVIE